jgi:dolichol kinase
MGSGAFFLTAFALAVALSAGLGHPSSTGILFLHALAVAAVSAFTEGMSTKGSDNLTIPAAVLLVMIVTHFILNSHGN